MHIDHVVYATNDLDAAAERLEAELGLPTLPGGRHDGLGTHNRIMPLGGGYLELLAVAESEEMSHSVLGVAIRTLIEQTADGLAMWAVAVDDVGPIAARLGTSVIEIARQGLSASLTGLMESTREPFLPFFISRHRGVADPGSGGDAGGISWIEVGGMRPASRSRVEARFCQSASWKERPACEPLASATDSSAMAYPRAIRAREARRRRSPGPRAASRAGRRVALRVQAADSRVHLNGARG